MKQNISLDDLWKQHIKRDPLYKAIYLLQLARDINIHHKDLAETVCIYHQDSLIDHLLGRYNIPITSVYIADHKHSLTQGCQRLHIDQLSSNVSIRDSRGKLYELRRYQRPTAPFLELKSYDDDLLLKKRYEFLGGNRVSLRAHEYFYNDQSERLLSYTTRSSTTSQYTTSETREYFYDTHGFLTSLCITRNPGSQDSHDNITELLEVDRHADGRPIDINIFANGSLAMHCNFRYQDTGLFINQKILQQSTACAYELYVLTSQNHLGNPPYVEWIVNTPVARSTNIHQTWFNEDGYVTRAFSDGEETTYQEFHEGRLRHMRLSRIDTNSTTHSFYAYTDDGRLSTIQTSDEHGTTNVMARSNLFYDQDHLVDITTEDPSNSDRRDLPYVEYVSKNCHELPPRPEYGIWKDKLPLALE